MSNLNDWHLDANKKVMRTETDNWYLRWKVDYLEKKIKEQREYMRRSEEESATSEEIQEIIRQTKENMRNK